MKILGCAQKGDNLTKLLLKEVELARREIREGRFQRTMAILVAFAAIASGFEAYLQHLRGAFAHWLMWTPILLTVPTVIASGVALLSGRAARRVLPAISLVSLVDGIIGFAFHIRGIRRLPGGFRLGQYNVMIGPPVFAPLLVGTVGVMGIIAGLLRREELGGSDTGSEANWVPMLSDEADGEPRAAFRRLSADIAHGRFQRGMALIAAFFGLLASGEAYFEHLHGSFNQRLMWTPVWLAPLIVIVGLRAAFGKGTAAWELPVASAANFLDGLLGFALHLRGLSRMPGGLPNLRYKLAAGPPLFAPLLLTAVGLLGFIAALLRRKGE